MCPICLKERPKSRVEIARLLNRDDTSNIQYGLRKLLRAGLIEKVDAGARKTATYRATPRGIEVTEAYAVLRKDLLMSMTGRIEDGAEALRAAGDLLDLLSGVYDQAAKLGDDLFRGFGALEDEDAFGASLACLGDLDGDGGADLAVGALRDDDGGGGFNSDRGAVWVLSLEGSPPCLVDLNGDGVVNTQDFLRYLNLWNAGEPLADWNGDGDTNTRDVLAYLTDWIAGC